MSLKVLLADAGDILKSMLELSEEDQDIEVVHVTSGMDALLRIKEIKPDVLIADVSVPGVDGYSLCEIAGKEADLADMKSVLTSEEGTEVDESRVEATATDGYLPKPFNADKLLIHLGLKTAEAEDAEEEAQDEGAFQMDVSDDMSFADVALSEEQASAEDEFSVEESPVTAEAEAAEEDEDEEQRKPESLDSILGLDDDEREEVVDVDLGGEEVEEQEEEEVPLQMAESSPAAAGPFDTSESPETEERSSLYDDETPAAANAGDMAGDLASEEGQRLVEEIVKRLSDKVVREVAWEVVPDLAERIIKETLEKITK